jgi:hypothetical protein
VSLKRSEPQISKISSSGQPISLDTSPVCSPTRSGRRRIDREIRDMWTIGSTPGRSILLPFRNQPPATNLEGRLLSMLRYICRTCNRPYRWKGDEPARKQSVAAERSMRLCELRVSRRERNEILRASASALIDEAPFWRFNRAYPFTSDYNAPVIAYTSVATDKVRSWAASARRDGACPLLSD